MKYIPIIFIALSAFSSISLADYKVGKAVPVVQQNLELDLTKNCDFEYTSVFHGYICLIPMNVFDLGEVLKVSPQKVDLNYDRTFWFGVNRAKGAIEIRYAHSTIGSYLDNDDDTLEEAKRALNILGNVQVTYQGPEL